MTAKQIKAKGTGIIKIVENKSEAKEWCSLQVAPNLSFQDFQTARELGAMGEIIHPFECVALQSEGHSQARLFITREYIGGFWTEGDEEVYIEPLSLYQVGAPDYQFVIHKVSDEIHTEGQSCSTIPSYNDINIHQHEIKMLPQERTPTCWKTEIMADGDFEYYRDKASSNWNLAAFLIGANLNNADAKFAAINMDFIIPNGGIGIYTDPNAWWYYPKSSNGDNLLVQMRDFHNYFHANVNRDIWVLFSGKNIFNSSAGSALVGIAYVDVVCNNLPLSYAVVEWTSGNLLTNTTAHEIGHTFGAKHTGEVTCPAGTTGGGIMNAIVPSTTAGFSSCSSAQMNWHIWFNHGCLYQGNCN